ncbi:MAG: aldolase/citrate lyase family protein [Anaerolineaceae bacterium]|nr:aldolase/citrate lyase family protein [Anaerolineaceae bacterium]MDE0329600.1 aldolase/citrate lyase family protein [Anaerolineaceae bacterium]
MITNLTKAKLNAGESVYGCFFRTPDPTLAEFMGYLGWDFLILDAEHGSLEPNRAEDMVRALELRRVTPLVRVTTNQPHVLLRFLDAGAQGVHVPWVNTPDDAERALQAIKYQPRGMRGLAGVRPATFARQLSLKEYVARANEETLTVLQLESGEAIDNLNDILAVSDIDVLFLGRTDLSHSLGYAGDTSHPEVEAVVARAVEQITASDVALGVVVPTVEEAQLWRRRGARYIATTLEAVVGASSEAWLAGARA